MAPIDIYNHCRTVHAHVGSIVRIVVCTTEAVPMTVMVIIMVMPVIMVTVVIMIVVGTPGSPVRRIVIPVPG